MTLYCLFGLALFHVRIIPWLTFRQPRYSGVAREFERVKPVKTTSCRSLFVTRDGPLCVPFEAIVPNGDEALAIFFQEDLDFKYAVILLSGLNADGWGRDGTLASVLLQKSIL
jgi:hypothetical protein